MISIFSHFYQKSSEFGIRFLRRKIVHELKIEREGFFPVFMRDFTDFPLSLSSIVWWERDGNRERN